MAELRIGEICAIHHSKVCCGRAYNAKDQEILSLTKRVEELEESAEFWKKDSVKTQNEYQQKCDNLQSILDEAVTSMKALIHLFELWEKGPLARAGIIWESHPPAVISAKEAILRIEKMRGGG